MADGATGRFTRRAEQYARYRPHYPAEVAEYLAKQTGLSQQAAIADIGSGTGILTALWVERGYQVYGVEPDEAMRTMAEKQLGKYANFSSIAAPAEATTLPASSIDLISVAQAFQWFEPESTRREFQRILKPEGHLSLMWLHEPGEAQYERAVGELVKRYLPPREARRGDKETQVRAFFGGEVEKALIDSDYSPDWEHYQGRWLSASWVPLPGEKRHEGFMKDLRALFEQFAVDGRLALKLRTELYWGRLVPA